MILRDDDVSYKTDPTRFKQIHEMFAGKKAVHTIAVICKDLELNMPLVDYINECGDFDIQVHCWEHVDLVENNDTLIDDILKCKELISRLFNVTPTTIYPPWNKTNNYLQMAAAKSGLDVNNVKCSLSTYVRYNGKVNESVINFHHWADECKDLPKAIEIYENSSSNL